MQQPWDSGDGMATQHRHQRAGSSIPQQQRDQAAEALWNSLAELSRSDAAQIAIRSDSVLAPYDHISEGTGIRFSLDDLPVDSFGAFGSQRRRALVANLARAAAVLCRPHATGIGFLPSTGGRADRGAVMLLHFARTGAASMLCGRL
jgi:hypothetical protein